MLIANPGTFTATIERAFKEPNQSTIKEGGASSISSMLYDMYHLIVLLTLSYFYCLTTANSKALKESDFFAD